MMTAVSRRRRPRRSVAVLALGAIVALLTALPAAVVVGAEPAHATGWIHYQTVDVVVDGYDDTVRLCGPSSTTIAESFVIGVRLERRGNIWVDAGSTFRGIAMGSGPPCQAQILLDCWQYDEQSIYVSEGRLFGQPPLPALVATPSISLSIDPVAGTASFGATIAGGGYYGESGAYGGACPPSYPGTFMRALLDGAGGGWHTGQFSQVPPCPAAEPATGTLDASQTHISFACHVDERGTIPTGTGTYHWTRRVDGRIALSP